MSGPTQNVGPIGIAVGRLLDTSKVYIYIEDKVHRLKIFKFYSILLFVDYLKHRFKYFLYGKLQYYKKPVFVGVYNLMKLQIEMWFIVYLK